MGGLHHSVHNPVAVVDSAQHAQCYGQFGHALGVRIRGAAVARGDGQGGVDVLLGRVKKGSRAQRSPAR
jgi:hypothetical protein